jgi:hypothetical protein
MMFSSSNSNSSNLDDNDVDRLFLVYYALDSSLNINGWSVSPESLERNIRSFIGKPVVLKQKDQFNPNDLQQTGNFVHPIMKNANLEENLNYQQQFAVGRINDVSLNPQKGWRFDVEITDPQMKQAFKSNTFTNRYPKWVSPQIATFPDRFPGESNTTNIEHWHGIHLAFVDYPAYGFQKTDVKGQCYGSEQMCEIQLRSASFTKQQQQQKNNKVAILSASFNDDNVTDSEKAKARKMFEEEKAKVQQELSNAKRLYNTKRKFSAMDAVELHSDIMGRGIYT